MRRGCFWSARDVRWTKCLGSTHKVVCGCLKNVVSPMYIFFFMKYWWNVKSMVIVYVTLMNYLNFMTHWVKKMNYLNLNKILVIDNSVTGRRSV